jgi:hypothetical protein
MRLVRLGLGLQGQRPLLRREMRRVRVGLGLQRRPLQERQVRLVRLRLGLQGRPLLGRSLQQRPLKRRRRWIALAIAGGLALLVARPWRGLWSLDPAKCVVAADSGADPALAEAAERQWSASYVAPASGSHVQDKAFFLATYLRADAALLADLAKDATLASAGKNREDALRAAPAKCDVDAACHANALAWSDADAAAAGEAIVAALGASGRLAAVAKDLRASGRFALHATLADDAFVKAAWRDLVTALGATFDAEAKALGGAKLRAVIAAVIAAKPGPLAFFEPLLEVDLAALAANGRDEAARYEPLAAGENAMAVARIPSIAWSKYPFTIILVPGQGMSNLDDALAAGGARRADLAVERFARGFAPLVAVSGGHVHPDRTPYSEAIEMKKYLRAKHGVPEDAILVDPHARHTTTNLRNVARFVYRYGVPADRPLLVTSDFAQSFYIGHWDGLFGPRCDRELGYKPWRALVSLTRNDSCMLPAALALHADGRDPLDP